MNCRRLSLLLLLMGLAVCYAPRASADYAVLRSGQRLHISGYLRQGSKILLYVAGGGVVLPSSDVVRFDPEDTFTASPSNSAPQQPFSEQIQAAAQQNGVDSKLVSSVISVESNFNSRAVSRKHAMGLMQLMPQTAAHLAVRDPFDPAQNIDAGTRYLKQLLDRYHGNLALALAAYNAGPLRVAQYGGIPPFSETKKYIHRVAKKLQASKPAESIPPTPHQR